jgi:hypothetical protein
MKELLSQMTLAAGLVAMSPQALAADQVWHTQDRATTLVSADDGIMHKSFMYDLGSEIIYVRGLIQKEKSPASLVILRKHLSALMDLRKKAEFLDDPIGGLIDLIERKVKLTTNPSDMLNTRFEQAKELVLSTRTAAGIEWWAWNQQIIVMK